MSTSRELIWTGSSWITLWQVLLPFISNLKFHFRYKNWCAHKQQFSCLTEGFKEAAEKFRMESGIEPSVDLDSLDERIKIREMILKGQIQDAIALINSLHPELLDTNRYLYFHLQVPLTSWKQWTVTAGLPLTYPLCVVLQQQHLIELIRLRETEAALEFAQSQLAEQGEESRECLTEMERTLALLAFDNPEESPFGDLLNMMQRQKVRTMHSSCHALFTLEFHVW